MGLARLWQSWGIEPDVVLGHSVGQYAAACVAGVFSLEDGARLVAERGRLFGSLPEGGRMVAVFADPEHVEDVADEFPRVSVAAYNGPNTVLSGPGEDLERLVATCSDDGIRCSWLDTSHAFHSELLEPALDEFESYAAQFEFAVPALPLICNRTGTVLTAATPLNAQYWRRHARQPVQFAESVRTVAQLGCSVLMEIGPQPILSAAALQVWPEHSTPPRAIASARKGADARRQITEAVAAAYVAGHRPNFAALQRAPRRRLELPTYPFQRRSFWPKTCRHQFRRRRSIRDPGRGNRTSHPVTPSTPVGFSVKSQPWLADHVIYGTVVVPGATYAAMVLAAVEPPAQVQEVFFYEPILLGDKDSRDVQLTLHPSDDGEGWTFQVSSRPYGDRESDWSLNAGGTVRAGAEDGVGNRFCGLHRRHARAVDPRAPATTVRCLRGQRTGAWARVAILAEVAVGRRQGGGRRHHGRRRPGRARRPRAGPSGAARPLHRHRRRCALRGGVRGSGVGQRNRLGSVLAAALWAGRTSRTDAAAVLLPCAVAAQWSDSELQVFDLDFVDRDGGNLGGIREFTVKRAPREALLRSLGGDATRMLYGIGWRETRPPSSGRTPQAKPETGWWPGSPNWRPSFRIPSRSTSLPIASSGGISSRGPGQTARRYRASCCGPPDVRTPKSRAPNSRPGWRAEVGQRARRRPRPAGGGGHESRGRTVARHRTGRCDRGRRAGRPGPGGAVGAGPHRHRRATDVAVQAGRRRRIRRCRRVVAGLLGTPGGEPELALRQGKLLVPRVLPWARSGYLAVPRTSDYALHRPNVARSTTCG